MKMFVLFGSMRIGDDEVVVHNIVHTEYMEESEIESNWKSDLLFGCHHHPIGVYWAKFVANFFSAIFAYNSFKKSFILNFYNSSRVLS